MLDVRRPIARLGRNVINGIWRVGSMARFFTMVLAASGTSVGRFRLVTREVYFSGVQSLVIIIVSGLFVGMVLGLQGFETLQKYGATESIGVVVALSLVRELGPVVAALLFASRAGSAITAGDRPHEGDRTAHRDGHDGGLAHGARHRAQVLGGRDLDAAPRGTLFLHGRLRRLRRRRRPHRRRQRRVLVANAGGGGLPV
jgi:hypothetical protein